jgi:hypothetical protein
MNEQRLKEIEAREKAASPGPWIVKQDKLCGAFVAGPVKKNGKRDKISLPPITQDTPVKEANAIFIAHARQDVLELRTEVRRLRAAIEEFRKAPRTMGGRPYNWDEKKLYAVLDEEPKC